MPRTNTLPRISIPVVINEPQREAILALAEKLHIISCPTTENDVIRVALRDLHALHIPGPNPFNEE